MSQVSESDTEARRRRGEPLPASLRIATAAALAVAFGLAPPVAGRLFALAPPTDAERSALWVAAVAVAVAAVAGTRIAPRFRAAVTGLWIAFVLLAGAEGAVRLAVRTAPDRAEDSIWLAERTRPENHLVRAQPFLHYTGNRGANNAGFLETPDFTIAKTPGTVRVACVGGSTTAGGNWPWHLQRWLDDPANGAASPFEVLNFAHNGYSSAHVLVNFVLNVVEYDPDYVVVHSGWNDFVFRAVPGGVASDYANVFAPFSSPDVADGALIRASVIYRWLHARGNPYPVWSEMSPTLVPFARRSIEFDRPEALEPLRRNVEKLVDLAVARDIVPVVTTQPYARDGAIAGAEQAPHLAEAAAALRTLAERRAGDVVFVDLERQMRDRDELFEDLGHLWVEGQQVKARLVGAALLADRARRSR